MRHPSSTSPVPAPRKDAVLAGVRESEWLRDWPLPAIDTLVAAGRGCCLAPGEAVSTTGVPVEGLHVILSGCLKVTKTTSRGHEFVIRLLPPGRLYGMTSVLDGLGSLHSALAFGATETWYIPKVAFLNILAASPNLYPQLIRLLCGRVRLGYRIIDAATLMPLRQRLANRLIELAEAHGTLEQGGVAIAVGQDAIAGLVGATRQHVNRELKALEREHSIRVAHRQIVLLNHARLEVIARSFSPIDDLRVMRYPSPDRSAASRAQPSSPPWRVGS